MWVLSIVLKHFMENEYYEKYAWISELFIPKINLFFNSIPPPPPAVFLSSASWYIQISPSQATSIQPRLNQSNSLYYLK